jgi:peptidoglycan/LPS O-acetylase OafA/YrhL
MLAFAWAVYVGDFIHKTSAIQIEEGKFFWTLIFAAISFYAIEKPFLRMKQKFEFTSAPPLTAPLVELRNRFEVEHTEDDNGSLQAQRRII